MYKLVLKRIITPNKGMRAHANEAMAKLLVWDLTFTTATLRLPPLLLKD